MRPRTLVLPLILIASLTLAWASSPLPAQALPSYQDAPQKTPTETPASLPLETPYQTPTTWYIILVTPTPQKHPPSLQIPDLDKKLKNPKSPTDNGTRNTLQSSPPNFTDIDSTLETFLAWLAPRQAEYRSLTGRYCQMLPSHTSIPADGIHLYPDNWYAHPSDQDYSWDALNAVQFEPLPVSITIDTYTDPQGPGYIVTASIIVDGALWQRAINVGPLSSRAASWSLAP